MNVRLRQLLPPEAGRVGSAAWEPVFALLDSRTLDLAIAPFGEIPARFATADLQEEDFAIVSRPGHPFARSPGLREYCAASHLVVSLTGDPRGFVDRALAERGLSRRVALTVPGFFMALAVVAETDLLAAVPRTFALAHAPAAGLSITEPPLSLPRFQLRVVLAAGALGDPGLAWLRSTLVSSMRPAAPTRRQRHASRRRSR